MSLHSTISTPTNTTLFIEKEIVKKTPRYNIVSGGGGGGGWGVRIQNGEARRAKREDSDEIGVQQCDCVYNFVADYKLF